MKKIILVVGIFLFGFQAISTLAMSSTNYQINADAINSGGDLGSSTNFKAFDSIGEPLIDSMSSTNFAIGEGLSPMITYRISLSLDSNTKNLGSVNAGTPISASTTASVTTDSWGGYDLYVAQNDNLKHTDGSTTIASYSCAIASPCLWSGTGFGFTLTSGTSIESKWGTTPNFKYAAVTGTTTLFHTKAGYMSGADNTVVEYKLDVPTTQKSGNYTNILTYTAVTKL